MPSELSAYRSHSENTDKSRIWTRSVRLLPLSTLSPSQIRMLLLYISGPYKKASRKLNYQILTQLRYSIPVHKCSWEKFFLVLTAKTLEFFVLVDKESFLFSVVHVFTETMNHWHLSQSRFLAGTCEPWGRLQAGTQQLPSCACTPRAPPDTTVISPINCYAILSSGSF